MRISVDIGFGYTKAVNEAGRTVSFPSVVGRRFASTLGGLLGGDQEDYVVGIRDNQDPEQDTPFVEYYVGDAAMAAGGNRTWEEEADKNQNLNILVATAVHLLLDNDEEVELAVGLPMSFYNSQRKAIRDALRTLNKVVTIRDKTKTIKISNVFVFPQSAGVYYSVLHNIDGSVKNHNLINRPVGVIDVGHRTVDLLFMTRGKKGLLPREDLCGSEDLGMNEAHKIIQIETSALIKGNADLIEVEKALLWFNCEYDFKGQTFNIRNIRDRAYAAHAQKIIAWVKQKWSDEINNLAAVIIGGGGGDALYSHFESAFPGIMKVENPSFGNAFGYLGAHALAKLAEMQEKALAQKA